MAKNGRGSSIRAGESPQRQGPLFRRARRFALCLSLSQPGLLAYLQALPAPPPRAEPGSQERGKWGPGWEHPPPPPPLGVGGRGCRERPRPGPSGLWDGDGGAGPASGLRLLRGRLGAPQPTTRWPCAPGATARPGVPGLPGRGHTSRGCAVSKCGGRENASSTLGRSERGSLLSPLFGKQSSFREAVGESGEGGRGRVCVQASGSPCGGPGPGWAPGESGASARRLLVCSLKA